MYIKQIRNATLRLDFGGIRFLIDPYLAEKDAYAGLTGTLNSDIRNPRLELKTPMDEILSVDAVIVTHTHPDHWDDAAVRLVPKHLPLFTQHEKDAELIRSQGFTDVRVLTEDTNFDGVSLIKTPGRHGAKLAVVVAHAILGDVCGVVFRHSDEKTLYIAGDTIWYEDVEANLAAYSPDVIVLNAGDARAPVLGSIIMGTEDVKKVHQAAPNAVLVASHMEVVNHCVLSRNEMRAFAHINGIAERLLVPDDNQSYHF